MLHLIRKALPLGIVENRYVNLGTTVGDALSYWYMGPCVGFEGMLKRLVLWEQEYARRGFQTIDISDFIDHGGYGEPIQHLLRQPHNGKPIYHAREMLVGYHPWKSVFSIDEMVKDGKTQVATIQDNGQITVQKIDLESRAQQS